MTAADEDGGDGDAPIGQLVDATPARRLEAVTLQGRFGSVERLDAARHGEALWEEIKGDDGLWTYMFSGPFARQPDFSAWLAAQEPLADPFYFAILDRSGRALGLASLMSIRPEMRVIEIGNILLGRGLQRTPLATEAQYLLARHAFETLRYRRHEWKCNALNAPSRRAALRFGFAFEGIFRSHMIVKGRNRDTAWFAILDTEWPARKAAFERWLDPANFDRDGRQQQSLRELNEAG
jgi:RimJ/RimL family protein N-acetyltransferase